MTDLERASAAGFVLTPAGYLGGPIDSIEQLAAAIRADEREKCAVMCDSLAAFTEKERPGEAWLPVVETMNGCATAIRALSGGEG